MLKTERMYILDTDAPHLYSHVVEFPCELFCKLALHVVVTPNMRMHCSQKLSSGDDSAFRAKGRRQKPSWIYKQNIALKKCIEEPFYSARDNGRETDPAISVKNCYPDLYFT